MTVRKYGAVYACDTCPELHTTAIGASLCCSPLQDADDEPTVVRGED